MSTTIDLKSMTDLELIQLSAAIIREEDRRKAAAMFPQGSERWGVERPLPMWYTGEYNKIGPECNNLHYFNFTTNRNININKAEAGQLEQRLTHKH